MSIDEICADRLAGWRKQCVRQDSTPILLLGVGHGTKNLGHLLVLIPEELEVRVAIGMMKNAVATLEAIHP